MGEMGVESGLSVMRWLSIKSRRSANDPIADVSWLMHIDNMSEQDPAERLQMLEADRPSPESEECA